MRLPIVPMAIKYLTVGEARPAIAHRLAALERAIGVAPAAGQDPYARLQTVGEQVLERFEREFGLSVPAGVPLAATLAAAKEHVLARVARELDVRPPAGATPAERMHFLDNTVAA